MYDNPPQPRFCRSCGSLLRDLCPKCGSDNPLRFRFCGACGAAVNTDGLSAPTPAPTATDALPQGERKTVTALFADIKDSTELMREPRPRGGARDSRPGARAYGGGCASLRRLPRALLDEL